MDLVDKGTSGLRWPYVLPAFLCFLAGGSLVAGRPIASALARILFAEVSASGRSGNGTRDFRGAGVGVPGAGAATSAAGSLCSSEDSPFSGAGSASLVSASVDRLAWNFSLDGALDLLLELAFSC